MAAAVRIRSRNDARRDAVRPAFGRPGTMRIGDKHAIEVTVVDLTRDGCRLLTDVLIPVASACQIGIGNVGLTAGRLVWQGPGEYGCAFDTSLPPGAVTAAFGGSNVATRPANWWQSAPVRVDSKLSARARFTLFGLLILAGWTVVLGAASILMLIIELLPKDSGYW